MTTADDAVRSGGSSGRCDPMHPASIAAAWLAQLADRCRELRHCARTLLVLPPCFDCYAQSPDACTKAAQGSSADLSSPGREQSCVAAGVGTWTAAALGSPSSALTGQVQRPRQAVNAEPVAGLQRCSASRATQAALGAVCTSCKARRPADGPLQLRLGMAADVSTLFCSDGREWGNYLTDCFRQQALTVTQEALDAISLPLPQDRAKALGAAKVSLLIVSPDLLELLERRGAELFSVGRLLEADRGLAMLCGVEPHELGSSLRAAFPNFSSWPLLEARNQDREFVIRLVETAREIVERADHSMRAAGAGTPQFRLCPRKVHQGNTKVFAMLNEPVEQTQKFQVLFESSGMHDLPVKWRNPYVLQFTVPETFLQVSKVVNVQLRCDGALLGVRQLKCESQMSQLHVLLQSATSPYEMLSLTLGLATLHDVDTALATNLRRNLPARGFHLLGPQQQIAPEKKRSEELLPTLLHFAAHYGLHELSLALLQCPGASACCQMLNCKGHSPAQLASNAGHHRLATTINDFQSRASTPAVEEDAPVLPPARVQSNPGRGSPPRMHYENVTVGGGHYASPGAARGAPVCNPSYGLAPPLPPPPPAAPEPQSADDDQEAEYLSMLPQVEAPPKGQSSVTSQSDPDEEKNDTSSTTGQTGQGTPDIVFSNTQEDLVRIIEMYKKGVPFSQIEKLFDDWKKNNENTKSIDDSNLQALRELYKQKQRAAQAAKQSFSLSDLRQIITGKGNRRGSRSRDIQHTTLPNMKQDDSTDGCRRVSTLSAVSTSSSGSSTSSDRLSTLSSMSAYDSGAHSDSCEEGRPPPRPPRLPAPRNPKAATHQYYAFAPGSADRNASHHHSLASPQVGNVAASTVSEVRANIPSSISLHGNMSTSAKPAVVNPSAGVYYDIPQVPRPVIDHRHNPLLDYDFPMAALRRVAPPPCHPEPDDGRHYYDIPKWGASGAPLPATPSSKQQVRLSIPDIPAPPVPDD